MLRIALRLVGLAVAAAPLVAQEPAPRFEVATIKPSAADSRAPDNSEVQPSGRVIITNLSLDDLVRGVFEVQRHQLVVGDRVPSWFASEKWDITALGPPLTSDEASQRRVRTMMQNLLMERFTLVTHRETRDTPVYTDGRTTACGCDRLTGSFDLEMTYTPGDVPGLTTSSASLFTAIQEQLGLRLEPRRAPVEVLVIDSVDRPTPD